MSHDINCPECNYTNTPGSKFCNNCGSKLPLSTHILCPNCSTSNTLDRVFCDHCGSRLIPDETPPEPEEPEPPEPAAGSGAFTLPTRKPGETGELDPSTLPDWLRSAGKRAKEDQESIEEIQSETEQTADLPEWLVHDSDPEPIINAPTTISTEFFMDLVDKAEDLPDIDELKLGQDDELLADAKNANLPDWLSEADAIPDIPSGTQTSLPEPKEIFSDIPDSDVLRDLDSDIIDTDDEVTPAWLEEPTSAAESDKDEGITEWLSDLEDVADKQTGSISAEDESSGLTEWLSDIDEDDGVDLFAEPDTAVSDTSPANDDDDWLNDFNAGDEAKDIFSSDEETPSSEIGAEPPSLTDLFSEPDDAEGTDWLSSFADDDPAEEPTDTFTDSFPEPDDKEETDWLSSIGDDDEVTIAPDEKSDDILTDSFPEPDDSEEDDWWADFAEENDATVAEATESRLDDLFAEDSEPTADTAVPEWEAVTDDQFDTLFEEDSTQEEALPDWLSAAEQDGDALVSTENGDIFTENIANTQGLVENAETDWLADLEGVGAEVPELSDDFLGVDDVESIADDLIAPLADDQFGSDPDWLSDLSAVDTGQLILDAEADLEAIEEEADLSEPAKPVIGQAPTQQPAATTEWDEADDSLLNMDDTGEMPDWMSQLDDTPEQNDFSAPPPLSSSEELPDWIADMRPGDNSIASDLGGTLASFDADLPETLEGLPTDLAGSDLPDWLTQDQPSTGGSGVQSFGESVLDANPEIPDWLKADDGETNNVEGDDWVSMLDELPASVPIASTLALAEMPEWVEELRPSALDENAPDKPVIPEGPEETEGPLAGLRGVIALETAVTQPHQVDPVQSYTITPEQQEQIALLQQITHEESGQGTILNVGNQGAIAPWLRIVLALSLIGIIIAGLRFFPVTLAKSSFTTAPLSVVAMDTVVNSTDTAPVLVAFEYTPSLSGELSPQAETLLAQLEDQGRDILTITQYPSGTAIAKTIGDPYGTKNLGYLPGNAIGLRQLSDCLTGESGCTTLAGHPVAQETRQQLKEASLIIVLTGNKDSLTNWIEQVGIDEDMTMTAGVTTAIAPSASPYFATGQLSGYLAGILDTAVYQDISNGSMSENVSQLLNAQLLGQLFTAIILLFSLIIYGVRGLSNRGKK